MTVKAVVVTHNNEETIRSCLESLQRNGVADIVVVDNTSSDQTAKTLGNLPVKLVVNKENVGFARAANQGAQSITDYRLPITDYILFLNPDAALQPGSLAGAVSYLQQHPQVGAAGLLLCDKTGRPERDAFGSEVTPLSLFTRHLKKYKLPITDYRLPIKCAWVSGGALLVRRSVFEDIGGFDQQFFMYWEDVDFCRRVRGAGRTVVIIPAARVVHRRGHSLLDGRRKVTLYDQSADRYFRKHYPALIWLSHRWLRRTCRQFWQRAR